MNRRILSLTPLMLAMALSPSAMHGAETAPVAADATGNQRAIAADASFAEAQALYRDAKMAEALAKVDEALRRNPAQPEAQKLKSNILAALGNREDRLAAVADWASSLQDVHTQEIAIRIRTLIESGDRAYARGDYSAAELDYDRAEVSLRTFPYAFDWADLPTKLASKRSQAQAQARTQAVDREAQSRVAAEDRARDIADMQEDALRAKVDELLGRARNAYDRKDFRRAELDAWNAYELDRRREDARKLYLNARREGHVLFDERHEDERLERVARVNEEIYRSMIPQSELMVYPEDWQRRNLRKVRELGSAKAETWVAALKDRLEQRVTFEFQEQPFEEVVAFLRQVTGVNIVVAPTVLAKGGGQVTLKVKDMRFADALKWILELTNLKMAFQNQAIFISDEEISGSVTLKLYDVADLIQSKRDFAGRELAFSSGGAGSSIFAVTPTDGNKPPSPDELVEFIKKNVSPLQWEKADNGFGITQRGGSTLFISATPETHNQIDQLLTSLRNQDSLQVSVDIRLLNVRKNYFEEIGIDWSQGSILPVSGGHGYTRVNDSNLINGDVNTVRALPDNAVNFNQFGADGARGLQMQGTYNAFNFLGQNQVSMILTAVENEADVQQVSQPRLTCFNGQRANASFMTQYAYIKTYDVVSSNLDPKIEVLTFGDIIDIRPVVSSDRKYIVMEVKPSSVDLIGVFTETLVASRVIGTTGAAVVYAPIFQYPLELPNVEVKGLRATIMLPDKGSMLLGGFQKSSRERTHVGIPFLSHIPFLGRLFSRNGTYDDNRKLFYMLHAEILNLNEKESEQ